MSYKIAVASSDGKHIDLNFGSAPEFLIYEVAEDGSYQYLETRKAAEAAESRADAGCQTECGSASGCGSQGGCGGQGTVSASVLLLGDCRTVMCKKIGFQVQKQLEKKFISSFDISGDIEEALIKITTYFYRADNHQTLRGIANAGKGSAKN